MPSGADELEMDSLVAAWIAGHDAEEDSPERESNWWATWAVMSWYFDGEAEALWDFVLAAYKRDVSDRVFSVLAAGPLEDLLAKHGSAYIDRVEQLAKEDEKFNSLLGGVWKNTMPDEVWQRVQAVRKEVW